MKIKIQDITKFHDEEFCEPEDRIFGFGEMVLDENDKSQKVIMDLDYLITGLTALKTLGFENVTLRIQNDYPILITDDTNHGSKLKGMIIAPRVYD